MLPFSPHPIVVASTAALTIICGTSLVQAITPPMPLIASTATSKKPASKNRKISFTRPPLKKLGAPIGSYRGGGSKGKCPPVAQPLTALVPVYELNPDQTRPVWALTASDRPTFWFYVPYTLTQDLPLEFVLKDAQGNYLYKTKFTQDNASPGVIKISLPTTVAALKPGEQYRWYFLIQCDSIGTHVEGVIEHQLLSSKLQQELQSKDPRARAEIYAMNGLWYDALTDLATFQLAEPANPDIQADWQSLLQSVGLEVVSGASITKCCQPE
jgi:hypothetical protein